MSTDISFSITLSELSHKEGVEQETLLKIVEYGIAQPKQEKHLDEWVFDLESAHWIRKAIKINEELEVDWIATAMIVSLIKSKEALKKENAAIKQQLDRLQSTDNHQ